MLQENSKIIISNPREGCEFLKGKTGTIKSHRQGLVNKSLIIYHVAFDENIQGLKGAGLLKEEMTVYQTPVQDTLNSHGSSLYSNVAWNGKSYSVRHGDPFDRGQADFYYGYPRDPHYYIGSTGMTPRIEINGMTDEQIDTYHAGYSYAQDNGDQKDWG